MMWSAVALAEGLRAGEMTAVDVVREAIERVRRSGERFGGVAAAEEPPPWRESETADYLWTLPWSLTGAPVVVVPCAGSAVQVVGRPWEEHVVLAAAAEIERADAPG